MIEDEDSTPEPGPSDAANDDAHAAAEARAKAALLTIARLIGRQIAREEFERRLAANDNRPAPKDDEDQETR